MSLKIGIVGLPNVGKSTLFKALTKNPVDTSNYPFCTIEPNVGVVKVPDERLEKLAEMSKSEKIVPAVVEFVDIAGIVKGASEGEGLGNKFLANIREVDAIAQVVRVFQNEKITHVSNKIDPLGDIEVINTELILADLETVNKTESRLEKEMKGNKKGVDRQLEIVRKIKMTLESGKLANETDGMLKIVNSSSGDESSKIVIREMSLLTMKPFLYVYNVADTEEKLLGELEKRKHVKLDIKIEEELIDMSADDQKELSLNSRISNLIVAAYDLLGLITFLTTGKDESRAWTIKKGSTAPEAGAAIHTDFQEKFIRADVIMWDSLLKIGSWVKAKELGEIKTVGKEHIMQDGEVVEFKI
ncbi:MAG TPA: redox-regulated ATPase YchF [Candidatus Moranbacteria bacterium]|nr:redox-regulated ATPase YchF [Candidatus Moranbacteria bacterium]HRZ33618.1 redox-regulated ATPase YchF [Candidatus Moranbacteria bacterium]